MDGMPGAPNDEPHIPVMLDEVLAALNPKDGDRIVDATFGAGGYSRAILARGAQVTAFDRDPTARAHAEGLPTDSFRLIEDRFSNMGEHVDRADGVVMDIGVSSMQIDEAARGFSFRADGPLDMRMGATGFTAADAVNELPRAQITRILGLLGEERQAPRVAAAIERARPLETTGALARAVEAVLPRGSIHPATRTFQALRIFVNRELDELANALVAAERLLVDGGRLIVVTFHSLEDRIVKRFLADRSGGGGGSRHMPDVTAERATFTLPRPAVVAASEAEASRNPRARSAKLRAAHRTNAPARHLPQSKTLGLPDLSSAYALLEAS